MTALPYVADVARIDIQWEVGSDNNALTRLHAGYSGAAPSSAACNVSAQAIYGVVHDNFLPLMNTQNTLRGVEVRDLSGEDAQSGSYSALHGGSAAGTPLPAEVAVLANYRIARHYRGGKPRSYLPLFTASDLDNPSSWKPASIAAALAAVEALLAELATAEVGGVALDGAVSLSYVQGYGAPRARSNGHLMYPPEYRATPKIDPITGVSINGTPSVQKRRNLR